MSEISPRNKQPTPQMVSTEQLQAIQQRAAWARLVRDALAEERRVAASGDFQAHNGRRGSELEKWYSRALKGWHDTKIVTHDVRGYRPHEYILTYSDNAGNTCTERYIYFGRQTNGNWEWLPSNPDDPQSPPLRVNADLHAIGNMLRQVMGWQTNLDPMTSQSFHMNPVLSLTPEGGMAGFLRLIEDDRQ